MKLTDAELTRLAAETVMNWQISVVDYGHKKTGEYWVEAGSTGKIFSNPHWDCRAWQPLATWSAAGDIVDKMRAAGWLPGVESGPKLIDGKWARVVRVRWGRDKKSGTYTSANFHRAITIAALLAVGAITEEQL